LISAHQNDLKTPKKNLIFLKNAFETQKQTGFYETRLKKHIKITSQKLHFKLNFLMTLQYKTQFNLLPNTLMSFVSPQTHIKNKCSLKQ
jgi:hypothetical protein